MANAGFGAWNSVSAHDKAEGTAANLLFGNALDDLHSKGILSLVAAVVQ